MSVNIGTSTSQYATANSFQRKLLKSSNGTLVLFAKVGTWIKYQTSADGITWSGLINVVDIGLDTLPKHSFDVYIDALEERSHLYGYEKAVARDSLRNLAEFLDDERNPFSVEHWGALNRKKHE